MTLVEEIKMWLPIPSSNILHGSSPKTIYKAQLNLAIVYLQNLIEIIEDLEKVIDDNNNG